MSLELILGTAQFDTAYGIARRSTSDIDACQLLTLAASIGVTALDTAPAYGNAQEMIGSCHWQGALHTKIPGDVNAQDSLKDSLLQLRRERVEVAYFHNPDVLKMDEDFFEQTHASVVPRLAENLGVSTYTPGEFNAALSNSFISAIQVPINGVDQRITDEQLKEAVLRGKRIFARSIFLQGALLQEPPGLPQFLSALTPTIHRLEKISMDTGRNRMEILIQSVLARPGISGIIVGAETSEQLLEIAAGFNAPPLTGKLVTEVGSLRLDSVDLIDPRLWPKQ